MDLDRSLCLLSCIYNSDYYFSETLIQGTRQAKLGILILVKPLAQQFVREKPEF